MRRTTLFLGAALAAGLLNPGSPGAEPVQLWGDELCGGLGEVAGLDPKHDGGLPVHDGPGTNHAVLDTLAAGQQVHICDSTVNWYGVVYGEGDCALSTPPGTRRDYDGPCRSGWVPAAFIEIIAG